MQSRGLLIAKDINGRTRPIKTLRNAIYYHLRDAILSQKLKPNQRIHEKDIAQEFGVSTTPVREAFLKLESEGYLNIHEHRGVTIRVLSFEELIELYEVISVLDGFAHHLSVRKMKGSQLAEIKKLTQKMEAFYNQNLVEEYLLINGNLHAFIWRMCGNSRLLSTLENIYGQILRYGAERLLLCSKSEIMKNSMEGHQKILDAFEIGDEEGIEMLVRKHWSIDAIRNYRIEISELHNLMFSEKQNIAS